MSHCTADLRASAEAHRADSGAVCAGSDNVCDVKAVRGDSESPRNPRRRPGPKPVPVGERLWAKVNTNGPVPAHQPHLGPCWIFTGRARLRGYGSIGSRKNGKPWPLYAHRLAWELTYGPIADSACVLHKCDTPLCCRPDHLFLGTRKDNIADARGKGRLDERRPRRSTLTFEQRLAIYETRQYRGVCVELAQQYGVTRSCIAEIRKGRFARPIQPASRVFERVPSKHAPIIDMAELSRYLNATSTTEVR